MLSNQKGEEKDLLAEASRVKEKESNKEKYKTKAKKSEKALMNELNSENRNIHNSCAKIYMIRNIHFLAYFYLKIWINHNTSVDSNIYRDLSFFLTLVRNEIYTCFNCAKNFNKIFITNNFLKNYFRNYCICFILKISTKGF
ncbi:hypothetical protein RFI_34934 [Reticulomyxa filosa]|uniref:Thiol oxidase n=1 Tax=Reticulomyxa filosa TaxID=46433 RepID=X6LMX9_RETFI|nr:hypothetical protein RFI_34934 [Reticulomyxa filosa]|eukprot:ETO02497.1 hypothetical protein RFI_34934 [Reticulomyxa filosa]